ncbi:hypothetical protein M9H77_12743 [Catharanthus roseus]|uniref:Uncharacterized protein n=1 Tax=Catharanthus roseus TaxID=4058 RepID=A0ACC0BI66_CATRO|nr:hypothetical protein M9H77_12743 [Catharanthus roseus]
MYTLYHKNTENDEIKVNGMVVFIEEALKNKLEGFEDQGKASKLFSICSIRKDQSREQIGGFPFFESIDVESSNYISGVLRPLFPQVSISPLSMGNDMSSNVALTSSLFREISYVLSHIAFLILFVEALA